MTRKTVLLLITGAAIGMAAIFMRFVPKMSTEPNIAIFTTVSHPALNSVREGFIEHIAENAILKIRLKDYNAEANMQQANMLARQIAESDNLLGIIAIGTLASQTIAKVDQKTPIIIAAVSDPKAITVQAVSNVCGLSDSIDADFQISSLLALLPHINSISLLYSPHEDNSSAMVTKLHASALRHNLRVNLIGVSEPQQIQAASIAACQKSDVVLIPLDNQLVASMPAVIKATKAHPCPIITSNESPIHEGATMAFGVDYKKMGAKVGQIMQDLINKKSPHDVGIINPSNIELYVNVRVATEKGLKLDGMAWSKVRKVEE